MYCYRIYVVFAVIALANAGPPRPQKGWYHPFFHAILEKINEYLPYTESLENYGGRNITGVAEVIVSPLNWRIVFCQGYTYEHCISREPWKTVSESLANTSAQGWGLVGIGCFPENMAKKEAGLHCVYQANHIELFSIATVSLAFPNSSCESTKTLTKLVTKQVPSLNEAHHSCEFGFAASYLLEKLQKAKVRRRLPSLIRVLDWKGKTVLLTGYKKCKNDRDCVKALLGKGKQKDRIMKSIKRQSMGANSIGCDLWKQRRRTNLFCIFSPKVVDYDDHYMYYDYQNGSDYSIEDPYADFATYE